MKKSLFLLSILVLLAITPTTAQIEPGAGSWKTWFISSAKEYRLPPPPAYKDEIAQVVAAQNALDSAGMAQIVHWNAGAPGYRWYGMMFRLWTSDPTSNGALPNMLTGTAIYDATIAAWDSKYAYNRPRPFAADSKIKLYASKPESPSYPCEHSVTAGVVVTLISHFYPDLKDSVNRMAQRLMNSRIAAGLVFPSDTRAGFELGKTIALKEIEMTKDFPTKKQFDGKIPSKPGLWNGKDPMAPTAGLNKTVVLTSPSEFRPVPPPDFSKDMKELKEFKQTFYSQANAFHYATQPTGEDLLTKKIFEYNLHTNPPRAARIYAAVNVSYYDAFIACWDAKYAYWGIRPDQYDSTYKPLVPTPPFPGYPSGHATMSGLVGVLYPYFFPGDKNLFVKVAKDGAESRFHAGIHFRSDNDAGLTLGKKIAEKVVGRLKTDGADAEMKLVKAGTEGKTRKTP
jgi:membrane-associated phospholipid phosphatase